MTEKRLEDTLQLQNEMLLAIIKSNESIFNDIPEDILDDFTEKVIKNSKSENFKERYGYLFKDGIHCLNCGFAKHLVYVGYNPRCEVPYRTWLCKNCMNKIREYEDGRVEIDNGD